MNFSGVLTGIARKAATSAGASQDEVLDKLKAAISSIDPFGAEGSQAVSSEEVRLKMHALLPHEIAGTLSLFHLGAAHFACPCVHASVSKYSVLLPCRPKRLTGA